MESAAGMNSMFLVETGQARLECPAKCWHRSASMLFAWQSLLYGLCGHNWNNGFYQVCSLTGISRHTEIPMATHTTVHILAMEHLEVERFERIVPDFKTLDNLYNYSLIVPDSRGSAAFLRKAMSKRSCKLFWLPC